MVSKDHRTGLYITIPLYFTFLAIAAYWAYRRMKKMKLDGDTDKLSSHYLGGRDFGPLLTAGTLFASLFSGYTVVGVPNEAYAKGFAAASWIPNLLGVVAGYFGTGLRLLRTSMLRNHRSPVDFVTDRYQSQVLRYMIVFLQGAPTLIYLSAQVVSIKSTFNSIFDLDPDSTYPVIFIMGLILVFEWIGGLGSVALTDCIQAVVMVLSFIILPIIIAKNFGGWAALDPETYPKPQFYQTPSQQTQWEFWQFSLVNFSFFTLPHLLQRTYAAKSPTSLQIGCIVMTIGPWLTTFVGIFLGTVGVAILANEDGDPRDVPNPFAYILEKIMDLGGFAKVSGVIAVTASLAAIMSTADSLIIAVSQLMTMEVVQPLRPDTTSKDIVLIGKYVSLAAVVVAILVGLLWDEGVSNLGAIQFAMSTQAVPTFLWGLFSTSKANDLHPWCLFVGALLSSIYVIAIYFGYLKPDNDSPALNAGITGLCINILLSVTLETTRRVARGALVVEEPFYLVMKGEEQVQVLYPGRPEWDIPSQKRFGGACLTPMKIWKNMEGINEPMANPAWCFMMFVSLSMVCPWTNELQPPLAALGSDSPFVFPPTVVNGLPWWIFKGYILSAVPTVMLLVGIYLMPREFPEYGIEGESCEDSVDSAVDSEKQESGRKVDKSDMFLTERYPSSFSGVEDDDSL